MVFVERRGQGATMCFWLLPVLLLLPFSLRQSCVLSMSCNYTPCARELYLRCPYGLQRDENACDICACLPSPGRRCSEMTCQLVCNHSPQHLYLCPTCACFPPANGDPPKTYYYGASPENVDAATTGQIRVSAVDVLSRHPSMCLKAESLRWRTMDGTCNNVHNYGATFMPVARVLPASYDDGRQAPRTRSVRGGNLPSPRTVSRVLHMDSDVTDRFSIMFMQFGQFIDHDMTAFPLPTEEDSTIRCCNQFGHFKRYSAHSDCFPIDMRGDPVFLSITCMEFIRSVPAMDKDGNMIYPRENVNAVTSFIDGSLIYGSSDERMRELRENNGTGIFLRTMVGDYLPLDERESCIRRRTSDPCFLAGDDRVNEQPGLTTLHTVFLRYHNRVASRLRTLRPGATDEEVFQRARAIVGATLQNILYGHWLPLVLGPQFMHRYGLDTGRVVQYNPDIDPRITSVFSTSAFRFGHSMIPHSLHIGQTTRALRDLFNKPFEVFENLDLLAYGLVNASSLNRRAQRVDHHFALDITNHLFEPEGRPLQALDLVSLNIQRGRDHGLPSFSRFRQACGLKPVSSFSDPALGSAGHILQQLYSDVNDIDMFPGSMVEPPQDGAIVGPTIACLLARQFHALKYGDRFFFEAYNGPHGFSFRQIQELRKTSLAYILCDTLQLTEVQRDIFQVAGPDNPMMTCEEVKAAGPNFFVLAGDT